MAGNGARNVGIAQLNQVLVNEKLLFLDTMIFIFTFT